MPKVADPAMPIYKNSLWVSEYTKRGIVCQGNLRKCPVNPLIFLLPTFMDAQFKKEITNSYLVYYQLKSAQNGKLGQPLTTGSTTQSQISGYQDSETEHILSEP